MRLRRKNWPLPHSDPATSPSRQLKAFCLSFEILGSCLRAVALRIHGRSRKLLVQELNRPGMDIVLVPLLYVSTNWSRAFSLGEKQQKCEGNNKPPHLAKPVYTSRSSASQRVRPCAFQLFATWQKVIIPEVFFPVHAFEPMEKVRVGPKGDIQSEFPTRQRRPFVQA